MPNVLVDQLIGKKIGCLEILGDLEHYPNNLEPSDLNRIKTESEFRKQFNEKSYICKCVKCGIIYIFRESSIKKFKGKRYCCDDCFDEKIVEKCEDYDVDYTNSIHESLIIKECIDDNCIYDDRKQTWNLDLKKRIKHIKICKKYRCECYLCFKEYDFKSIDFKISNDTYGANAKKGYYSEAFCPCHRITSFQWRTIKILKEYNINYIAEYSFSDLIGIGGLNKLRFDFAILDSDNNLKCLIECQGKQHYFPVEEFGGEESLKEQKQNDEAKREYAKNNNIPLIEIPYSCNTLEKEKKFLKKENII